MSRVVDLRSDTVSKPTEAMRQAMANAEVGDDVYGEDPSVNQLERRAAAIAGKEAALYVASGTMANLVAVMTHTQPGDEILLGRESHIFHYEVGGAARLANVLVNPLQNTADGGLNPEDVAAATRASGGHVPTTRLLCLENTQNRCGGTAVALSVMDELTRTAHGGGLSVHLDGARIFNAALALETTPDRVARDCDSVSFCLSKGLGCPVGSVLCGSNDFIERARRVRRMLGGGMRQAGIIAAAGLYALDNNVERLADDHANARRLAEALSGHAVFRVKQPQTNIVVIELQQGSLGNWLAAFAGEGLLATPFGAGRARMVTHLNVSTDDIDYAISAAGRAVEAMAL